MQQEYWKRYAWKLESDLRDAHQNAFFWRWACIVTTVSALALGAKLWLST